MLYIIVHLQRKQGDSFKLTNDLGVEAVKLAVRRFILRRGIPSCFISVNFKTFTSVEITNTDDDITNNKDVYEPTKNNKRRSQREAAKNVNMFRKSNEY